MKHTSVESLLATIQAKDTSQLDDTDDMGQDMRNLVEEAGDVMAGVIDILATDPDDDNRLIHANIDDLIIRIGEIYNVGGHAPPEDDGPYDVEARAILDGVVGILRVNPGNLIP